MIRVAVLGATGYAARELIALLLRHPEVQITALTTRQEDQPHLGDVHPTLRGRLDMQLQNLTTAEVAHSADCIFCCLPHAASAAVVSELLAADCRVVDFSADYRLNDADVYSQWYGVTHPDADRLGKVPYGLPELYREQLQGARLVANPGCYPTAAILALAPLLKSGAISPEGIVIDAKSGVSGAGRSAKAHLHFPEANENLLPYGVGTHRHTPEIDQVLSNYAGVTTDVVFTPHLVPMDRGELITAYANPGATNSGNDGLQTEELLAILRQHYADEQFIRVIEGIPGTKSVAGTNYCDITVRRVRGKVIVISAIDNLIKGASGAAVQNFNLMYGFEESAGL
ncbi:N-acetyl-gamma-glutamyl-phosphate reductase [Adhaeretor mobilis]|uniref:N-acetyl-gamma-glutamyl-phosphate reductase n=1 Tax=Adhaeretor mobilis TaxID=1930276 RepID=A0A517MVJ4_9BACT|nr:N-acetyl-gamma-glutamyl-phosphate reductase [Adhaeretor mobilis]QDS98903.1 N-acetyl-gamma-glutamyl-phosphate reductase [Adhaeretor mobilis]